jgi:hypothetical protein
MTTPTQIPLGQNLDAIRRSANAIFALVTASGPTSGRPSSPAFVGQPYFDTTLGYPVWWSGAHWVNASGAPA